VSDEAKRDRVRGALIGLAVGDAVGTTVEFKPPGTFEPVTDMVGGGPFRLRPGEWTDDTSMALCLAESLIECGGFNARDQMERYVKWCKTGYLSSTGKFFDIGRTTREALAQFLETGDPFAGSTDPRSAGNGSLMRLAPVAMFYVNRPEEGIVACGESSRTTHGAREAVDACRYFGGLLIGAMNGVSKAELLSPMYSPVRGLWRREPLAPKIAEVAGGSFLRRSPPEIAGTGYVVRSLEAALWAFATTDNYRDGCLAAVNLGDDADTTAAAYGQIAGAHYGESGIPAEWRERLVLPTAIDRYAESLQQLARVLPAQQTRAAR
jgi:ADP-ribosylglycohydrolase